MTVEVVAVHPTTVVIRVADRQLELPLAAFPQAPKTGQRWTISLEHQPSEAERRDQLNNYLVRD